MAIFDVNDVKKIVDENQWEQLFTDERQGTTRMQEIIDAVQKVAEGIIESHMRSAGADWPPQSPPPDWLVAIFARVFLYQAHAMRYRGVTDDMREDYRQTIAELQEMARREVIAPDTDTTSREHKSLVGTKEVEWTYNDLLDYF